LIEAVFPLFAEDIEPLIDLFHFCWVEVVVDLAAVAFLGDGFAFGEDLDMFRYGLAGGIEVFGNGVGCHCLGGQQDEDASAGGVCYGVEDIAVHKILNLQLFVCKFMCKKLVAKIFFWIFFGGWRTWVFGEGVGAGCGEAVPRVAARIASMGDRFVFCLNILLKDWGYANPSWYTISLEAIGITFL